MQVANLCTGLCTDLIRFAGRKSASKKAWIYHGTNVNENIDRLQHTPTRRGWGSHITTVNRGKLQSPPHLSYVESRSPKPWDGCTPLSSNTVIPENFTSMFGDMACPYPRQVLQREEMYSTACESYCAKSSNVWYLHRTTLSVSALCIHTKSSAVKCLQAFTPICGFYTLLRTLKASPAFKGPAYSSHIACRHRP
jgi:hypothetical protein